MADAAAETRQSRVGKRPVVVPKGVTVNIDGSTVAVQGPKGKLSQKMPAGVTVKKDGEDVVVTTAGLSGRDAPRLQGLSRALINNMVKGAAEGYERTLELVGTGYRCDVKGKKVNLTLGLSHPTEFELPDQVSASVPAESKGTRLVLSSPDKAVLGQIAATIRRLRPPEPYAGKGVRYTGEQIRRKAGKAGKGAGAK